MTTTSRRATGNAVPEPIPASNHAPWRRATATARQRSFTAQAVAPPPDRCAPLWDRPVPFADERIAPLIWLLGAHGGAGVSTLAHLIAPAADCWRHWPGGHDPSESPFVAIIARETIEGLTHAHDLLRQYHAGQAGDHAHLIGLITNAHQPGRMPKPIRRHLDVVSALVPPERRWRIPWQEHWPLSQISDLPVWKPGDVPPAKGIDELEFLRPIGAQLIEAVRAATFPTSRTEGTPR